MYKMNDTITVHALFGKVILKEIAITQLHSGAYQPRDVFSDEALQSLSKTIEHLGILEPLIIRHSPIQSDHYEIIAGERRFRAAKLAGLTIVPCLLTNYSDEQAAQIALIENTHREELNPIAEAIAMRRLSEEFKYTHDEIALLLGMSRAQVTNYLRLLTLEGRVQHWMKQGNLSVGHGKLLAGVPYEDQYAIAHHAIKKTLTVHMLDKHIKEHMQKRRNKKWGLDKDNLSTIKTLTTKEAEQTAKTGAVVKIEQTALPSFSPTILDHVNSKPDGNSESATGNSIENQSESSIKSDTHGAISLVEKIISEKFGYPINITLNDKNGSGFFQIAFDDHNAMHVILQKLGYDQPMTG